MGATRRYLHLCFKDSFSYSISENVVQYHLPSFCGRFMIPLLDMTSWFCIALQKCSSPRPLHGLAKLLYSRNYSTNVIYNCKYASSHCQYRIQLEISIASINILIKFKIRFFHPARSCLDNVGPI